MRERFCMRVAAILTIIASLVWGLPVLAAEPKFIDVLGPTKLTRPTGELGKPPLSLEVPVRLLKPINDITLQTASVSLGGKTLDPSVFTFSLEPQGNKGLGTLIVNINRQQADKTGEYTVTLLAWLLKAATPPDQSQAAPPEDKSRVQPPKDKCKAKPPGDKSKAAPPAGNPKANAPGSKNPEPEPQKLTFTFTKPAAKLQLMPTKIEQVIAIPWLWSYLSPKTVVLSETGGESNLRPYEQQWLYELTRKDGQPLPGKLLVSDLKPLGAWKQENAKVSIEGSLPLGTAKGAITIRAPELATHQAVFNVEVDTRASLVWLVFLLVVSIILGLVFRKYLEPGKGRYVARIAAEEQRGVLLELIDKTVDKEIKAKLMAVNEKLVKAIWEKENKPDELTTAAETAKKESEEIMNEATTTCNNFLAEINNWLVALETQDQAPAVREAINQAVDWLTQQQADLETGLITRVKKGFENGKQGFLNEIQHNLNLWLKDIKVALDELRPWPEDRYNHEVPLILDTVTTLVGQIEDIDEPDNLGTLLRDTYNLRQDLQDTLFVRHGQEIKAKGQTILDRMKELYPEPTNISLGKLEDAITSYESKLQAENRPDNFLQLMEAEARLWDSLKKVLEEGYQQLEEDKPEELPGLLEEGKFTEAYDVLRKAQEAAFEVALGEAYAAGRPAPEEPEEAPMKPKEEREPAPPVWLISVKVPEKAMEGEPVTVELSVTTQAGQPAPKPVVYWAFVGEPMVMMEGPPWQFVPSRSGTIVVQAEAEMPETGEKRSASAVIEIMSRLPSVEELRKKLWRSELFQTIVSGFILSVIGYAIFRVSFVGTVDDILAVGLWGFTLDIGVAKIREYAKPVQKLELKYPGKK